MFPPSRLADRRTACTGRAAVALLLGSVAVAAFGLPEDAEQPIEIQADAGSYDPDRDVSVLTGAVQIDQGSLRMAAHTVTVSNDNRRVARIVAEGSADDPARMRQRLRRGEPFVSARAARIDYSLAEERIEMRGNAHLVQAEREFAGEVIFYDVKTGRVDARSDRPGGVRLKWQPTPAPASD